ncbi:uncharacterized protein LOC135951979 [Calliphora vicina]|uniref:uncharacterized protein LOC135951979 n=1 Tax=Calliphora vicina TaxID=7373 RepID=UPI00325AB84A
MDSGTGAGVYLVDQDIKRSYRLSNECSVFQAEIFAIWKATELIGTHINRGAVVTIYVDSQAALKALECHLVHSNLGNEVADELARHGSDLDHDTRERAVRPPICHYYRVIYERFRDYTNQSWCSRTDCKVSRALWPRLNANATGTLIELDRYNLRILVGVITGHCSIGAFKGKWDNGTQDFCRVCGDAEELETVEHIMCNCPMLQGHRLRWLGNRFLDELGSVAGCKLSIILGFIKGIGWLFKGRSTASPNP